MCEKDPKIAKRMVPSCFSRFKTKGRIGRKCKGDKKFYGCKQCGFKQKYHDVED